MTLTTINDLNKLASDEKLIVLLEVEIPSSDVLYLANYNANVTFLGNEYQAFLFLLTFLVELTAILSKASNTGFKLISFSPSSE